MLSKRSQERRSLRRKLPRHSRRWASSAAPTRVTTNGSISAQLNSKALLLSLVLPSPLSLSHWHSEECPFHPDNYQPFPSKLTLLQLSEKDATTLDWSRERLPSEVETKNFDNQNICYLTSFPLRLAFKHLFKSSEFKFHTVIFYNVIFQNRSDYFRRPLFLTVS